MTQQQAISLYQPTLQAVAFKLLGSLADAEDAVQDTFVKWLSIDTSKIENTKAYLVRMVTNASLNIIQLKKSRQQVPAEDLQDVLQDEADEKALLRFDLDNQLSEAWAFLQKRLEPVEQTALVLREVFHVEYEDLQFVINRKTENCRQIVSRAKSKLRQAELPKLPFSLPDMHLLESFKAVCQKGNLSQLIQDFTLDIFSKKS